MSDEAEDAAALRSAEDALDHAHDQVRAIVAQTRHRRDVLDVEVTVEDVLVELEAWTGPEYG